LVVEDDPDCRDGLVACLELDGAQVAAEQTGNAGFRAFARERPDVLVSDLWMPDGSGYELIERVRCLSPDEGGLVPAIAVSASDGLRAALMAGFHAFLPKPFDGGELCNVVAAFAVPDDPQPIAPWTLAVPAQGQVVITFSGRVEGGDMRAMMAVLVAHLAEEPVEIVSDMRQLIGFSPSVGSIAERAAWAHRRKIRRVRVAGGSIVARVISAAACKSLGIPCTFSQTIESPELSEP
jgi:CheY-like chemotaxis protein